MPHPVNDSNPEQGSSTEYIIDLAREAAYLPEHERIAHEKLVSDLIGDIALREGLLGTYHQTMAYLRGEHKPETISQDIPKFRVDLSKIGWISGDESRELPVEVVEQDDMTFNFVDLSSCNSITNELRASLKKQGIDEDLMKILKTQSIPMLWSSVKSGRGKNIRPISIGNRKKSEVSADQSLMTSYPAYKMDVQGSNNRAILMILDGSDQSPTIGLAALFDHDDDTRIYRALFAKQK